MSTVTSVKEHPAKPEGQNGEQLFDHRVRVVNEKTGQTIAYQPYATHIFGADKQTLLERPIGSGNMFDLKGNPIGRWEPRHNGTWEKVDETHAAAKPIPVDEKEYLREQLEAAQAELKAIKSEKDSAAKVEKVETKTKTRA